MIPTVRIQTADFDTMAEAGLLSAGRADIGAVVTFQGLCRGDGGTLAALELEHYPGMAEAQITRVVERAASRWLLSGVTVIHRVGKIAPGENIVLVITASRHRRAAYEANEFIMDFLKTEAPLWKKEHRADGTEGGWVDARESDDVALARWA